MLIHNRTPQRCLILSENTQLVQSLKTILKEREIYSDSFNDRKSALKSFFLYRHAFFLLDATFLPRHPHRLLQLFKMAHRTPGVIIFNGIRKNIVGFKYIKDSIIEIVEAPIDESSIRYTLDLVDERLRSRTRNLFIRDLLIQAGVAIPVLILLVYLLLRR
ncbi:MAG: hypothetical protein JXA18_01330 [Chitinispirillaceae bacterium]|nr:hypothetical protein [Chitinispirillaceae bacterium]